MRKIIEETKQRLVEIMKGDEELGLYELEKKLDTALENETTETLTSWLKEKRDTMAQQTSVEWIYNELVVFMTGNSDFESAEDIFKHGKEMHKNECISFAEQWEIRCNEKNMDSKEQLYNEIYKKQ